LPLSLAGGILSPMLQRCLLLLLQEAKTTKVQLSKKL
jgi:hypothetical protein